MNETWSSDFAGIFAATVAELAPKFVGESVAMIAVDCHPWHGTLALCALTESECADDPELRDPAEMASWRLFNCSDDATAWQATTALCDSMRSDYDSADDRAAVATKYLRSCAASLSSQIVLDAISKLERSSKFRLSVTHPDDSIEFCGP